MSQLPQDAMPLGKQTNHIRHYDPAQLCPIARRTGRDEAGVSDLADSWYGEDLWNVYELSWLAHSGKPEVAMAEIRVPAASPCLIESKSLKLYFNSFNMTRFPKAATVRQIIARDLTRAAGAPVHVRLLGAGDFSKISMAEPEGICLDDLEIDNFSYEVEPCFLQTQQDPVRQKLFSRLFRSCCPVTAQPDWATVSIAYAGRRIVLDGLLRYLVSYREHMDFHEVCVERIYSDIMQQCRPDELVVGARFTRRGGIDINPVRATRPLQPSNVRDPRQ